MRYLLITICLALISSCAEIKVRSSSDPKVNFDEYKTWCWLNGCTPTFEGPDYIYPEPILEEIVNLMAVEMQRKGYIQTDENADLMLNFQIQVTKDSALSTFVHEESLPLWENAKEEDIYYHFLKGTLIIDVADREKGTIIWRSVTQKYIPQFPDIAHTEVEKGIRKAMRKFPARKK